MELEKDVIEQESASSANNRNMMLQAVTRFQTGTQFVVFVIRMNIWRPIAGPDVGIDLIDAQKVKMLNHHRKLAKKTKIAYNSSPKIQLELSLLQED